MFVWVIDVYQHKNGQADHMESPALIEDFQDHLCCAKEIYIKSIWVTFKDICIHVSSAGQ